MLKRPYKKDICDKPWFYAEIYKNDTALFFRRLFFAFFANNEWRLLKLPIMITKNKGFLIEKDNEKDLFVFINWMVLGI